MTEQMPPALPKKVRDEIVARHATPDRALWREPLFWIAGAMVVTALVVMVLWVQTSIHDANGRAADNANGLAQANVKLSSLGVAPVKPSNAAPLPTVTVTVTPGEPAITDAMLDAAARRYFALHPPPAGKAAVVDYQALRAFIVAQVAHVTPSPGSPGADGQPGQPGPGLTQAQADQALADWCTA